MLLSFTEMVHSGSRPTVTGALVEADALPGGEHDRSHRRSAGALLELGDDVESAVLQVVVGAEPDHDRAHEVVALLTGVLLGGLAEFGGEGRLDVAEALQIAGAEGDREVVRDDAATLHIDGAVVVHLAYETASKFDGPDRPTGAAREHTIDHTLQTTLD